MTALGPSSRRSKPFSFPSPTARLASVFLATVIRRPFSRSRRRIWLFLVAGIPRGLMTATESTPLNRSPSSLVIRFLTFLLMAFLGFRVSGFGFRGKAKINSLHSIPETRHPNPDLLHVQLHRRRHRRL